MKASDVYDEWEALSIEQKERATQLIDEMIEFKQNSNGWNIKCKGCQKWFNDTDFDKDLHFSNYAVEHILNYHKDMIV